MPKGRISRAARGLPDRRLSMERGPGGRQKAHIPTEKQRELVAIWAAWGKSKEWMCNKLKISEPTLNNHYKKELEEGLEYANAELGGVLFNEARKGNVRALEQWFDRRGGEKWKRKTAQEHSGPGGGPIRYTDLSDEELDAKLKALTNGSDDNSSNQSDS